MKRVFSLVIIVVMLISLVGCKSVNQEVDNRHNGIYTLRVKETGENESTARYLEIAERSQELLKILEENAGLFIVDAYNYQDIDGKGTPLYTENTLHYPQEIDPYGESIRVSRNYFEFNPIATADGTELVDRIIYDDNTLNILVPLKYQDMEEQIIEAYTERFYFEKVTAANNYYTMAGMTEHVDISISDLHVNIIYVNDGQSYDLIRSDCSVNTGNSIEDPVVQIYTSNIHCNYAHSFLSQWSYFIDDSDQAEEAYHVIEPYVRMCGAEQSLCSVSSVVE